MKKINEYYKESPTKTKTRQKIIDVAIELFIDSGMDVVTMMDVARACDITTRNLYRYYPSKEYLVVDAAYGFFAYDQAGDYTSNHDNGSGIELLENLLRQIFEGGESDRLSLNTMRFIMYFDLYISKMDPEHPAFVKYVETYREEINELGHNEMNQILKLGISDGTINIGEEEIEFYTVYLIQALLSVIMRTIVKESENAAINSSLVDKQIEMMIAFLKKN